ncbi:hypothetical protein HGRIS_013794 [Hohenbuehelia grisea]|uniref:Sm domain-containing protein n=1 Tax=Hohenbuehelia grisea TaxID=104357 RepID=A0ABR3IWQ1_9AGAR
MHLSKFHPLPLKMPSYSLQHLHALLRHTLRISTTDGRVFIGTFAGTDQPLNVLLANAEEYRIGPDESPNGRFVGQILVPWRLVEKVEAQGEAGDFAQGVGVL